VGGRFLMGEVPLHSKMHSARYRAMAPTSSRDGLILAVLRLESLHEVRVYRGTSLIRNTPLLGPYSRTKPRVI
jgi:hypothetical protein